MTSLHELVTLLAGFLATAFAILRLTLNQTRGFTERLVTFFEDSLHRQEETIAGFRDAVDRLNDSVQENSLLVRHVAEWLQVSNPVGGSR